MRKYKNKQLVARDKGRLVAYIGIIDKDALTIERMEMEKQGCQVREVQNPRRSPEEIEAEKVAKLIKGEI